MTTRETLEDSADRIHGAVTGYLRRATEHMKARIDAQSAQIVDLQKELADRNHQIDRHREHLARLDTRIQALERGK